MLVFALLAAGQLFGQDSLRATEEPVEIDFLFTYYDQDGVHSPVTGGEGTEKLEDRAGQIIVNVPLDSATWVAVNSHFNYYTSASTDKINPIVSSASISDQRLQAFLTYGKKNKEKGTSVAVTVGGSSETDYISGSAGIRFSKTSKDGNREFSAGAKLFLDTWMLIFPDEIRGSGRDVVPTDKRRSFDLSFVYAQVINKRLQAAVSAEAVWQNGLLSTPFHRVFFVGDPLPYIERLPANRFKFPVSLRLNWFATDFLVVRSFYRFYFDSFGIMAHTAEIETPVKLGSSFTLYPFYRYHTQTGADFFAPSGQHQLGEEYFTSDYDLSAISSQKFGAGLKFAPVLGISKMKKPLFKRQAYFESIDVRYARYRRSDGLHAWLITGQLGFRLR